MKRNVRIALAQLEAVNGNPEKNMARAACVMQEAAAKQVDIIVFPELFYCGYDVTREQLHEFAQPSDGELFRTLSRLAIEHKIHIAMSYPEVCLETGNLYISLMMIDEEGRLLHNHRKSCVWVADLNRVTPGSSFDVFDTKFGRLGLLICYEIEFPEPSRILALQGAELLISSSACMDTEVMVRNHAAAAVQNSMYVAGVNNVSDKYKGRSLFSDQYGNVVAQASPDQEELLIHTFDLSHDRRKTYPAYSDYKNMFVGRIHPLYQAASEKLLQNSQK